MHSPLRTRGIIPTVALALALAVALPAIAAAKPEPGAKTRGFRLLAGAIGAMQINRVYCGLATLGQICVNASGSSTVGGANWPRGTADQYIFNSGLQLAGVIDNPGGVWNGDTTGAFFFNARGGGNGTQVRALYDASIAEDLAEWPAAAYVPTAASGDVGADIYSQLLQGKKQASQGDVWWVSWEGDPSQTAGGRPHPMGIVVETRGMGWNFPSGNEDIIYFAYTFYNITSTNRADYVGIRPEMVDILMEQATTFHSLNNAKYGITLPAGGYTISKMYAAFGTDMDVANASVNYASVNLPFALGYTYVGDFAGESNWTFDAGIFGPPFFEGAGFAGVKYLKGPTGPGEIQLFSNTVNGTPFPGAFNDANNTTQLWRYLSGNVSTAAGDQNCNVGLASATHICWLNNTEPTDIRFFQSSTELTLPPGGQGSIVVAYVFAAPVAVGGCAAAGCPDVQPGEPEILGSATAMASGVNLVDSISGYAGFNNVNGDTTITQNEFVVVGGSLLGKSLIAQETFNSNFLLPSAPEAPRFFTVPGDGQVQVIWQPSPTENTGDSYFDLVSDPSAALYNPNYRKFDVEGYRIYRGRVNNPAQLFLIAQFDYDGTVFNDYMGLVNPVATCAPNLGIYTDCPVPYTPPVPGQPLTVANENPIVSEFLQTKNDLRVELASGAVLTTVMDSAVTGGASGGFPPLADTGVPFIYVDNDVRNNFTYYYVVTAFDVNSYTSGPTSLESPKANPASVTPQKPASNYSQDVSTTPVMLGGYRAPGDVNTTNQSALFPNSPDITSNGTFTGPFPPADHQLGFPGFATQVVQGSGTVTVTLDSFDLGQVDLTNCCGGADPSGGKPVVYHFTLSNGVDPATHVSVPLQQDLANDVSTNVYFAGPPIDETLSSLYGGTGSYGSLNALFTPTISTGPKSGDWGLGGPLGEPGFTPPPGTTGMNYNGFRWFDGPSPTNNETMADPIAGACGVGNAACAANGTTGGFNNAGELTGVTTVYQPLSYNMYNREWRNVGETLSGATRAADFNVYWGANGTIDSVIDITHNVIVDYDGQTVSGGWAFLNNSGQGAGGFDNRPSVVTPTDWTCVEPLRSGQPAVGFFPCASAAPFTLSDVAELGTIAFGSGNAQSTTATLSDRNTANVQAQGGFFLYLAGSITGFEMPSLPADGTIWSLRSYTGIIYGGNGLGQAGDAGPYSFAPATRPFTAIHATMGVEYSVVNDFTAPVSNLDLSKVHTVPDPYYVTNEYEVDYTSKIIKFVNLPTQATIRIYSASGVLVRVLNYTSTDPGNDPSGGMLDWNVRNRSNQVVASGVYFYHVESGDARHIGRMTIVNYAQ